MSIAVPLFVVPLITIHLMLLVIGYDDLNWIWSCCSFLKPLIQSFNFCYIPGSVEPTGTSDLPHVAYIVSLMRFLSRG